ncbi:MAG: PIN domain-containing protein, partial [Candidatus Dormibacteraeota bacterium]|nr:PIN domain-containing protein [Candidatus Dormibacteraeota bacterium]
VSMLVIPEARGIVNTGIRRGLAPRDANRLWRQLRHGLALARHVAIEVEDYQRAQDIMVEEPSLVAADALHIAVAQGIGLTGARVTFMTADQRQARAAQGRLDEVRLLD